MTLKDKIMKIREVFDNLQTAFTISSITIIVLQILDVIKLSNTIIPLPILFGCLYLLIKCIPISLLTIKKQLLNKDFNKITDEEKKDFDEIVSVITDKCTTIHGQISCRTEPISQIDNVVPSVYVDSNGIEYVKRY